MYFRRRSHRKEKCARESSHPLHKTIHHALLAGAVELNRELVAVDCRDVAVAEFLVEDAVAKGEGGHQAGRLRHLFAFDGERQAAAAAGASLLAGAPGGGGRGVVGRAEAGAPRALTRACSATSPRRGEVR